MKVPSDVAPSELFNLLLAEWHLPAPNLVVSLVGEERPFAMKSWLRDVLRKGLVKVAQSTGEAPPEPLSGEHPSPWAPVASSVRPKARAAPQEEGRGRGPPLGAGASSGAAGAPCGPRQDTLRDGSGTPCLRVGPHHPLRLPRGDSLA